MKTYKIHDSMRLSIAAIRDKLQSLMDADQEFDVLSAEDKRRYARLLDTADRLTYAAMYQETDGRTLKDISRFISENAYVASGSVWALA